MNPVMGPINQWAQWSHRINNVAYTHTRLHACILRTNAHRTDPGTVHKQIELTIEWAQLWCNTVPGN